VEVDAMEELSATLKAFCEQADLLRLAYLDPRATPRVVPVWYVMIDDSFYIGVGTTSAKWKAMKRDARVGWVVDGGTRGHYKGASMRGRAEEVRDATWRARVYETMSKKYFGTADDARFVEIFGHVDDAETVYVRLVSDDELTWEY
jgi:nitroimidazol reductase NimA-like FMN-containing flavoprotein (pyridoxamine 5'-phosphate oxidase superfamily)